MHADLARATRDVSYAQDGVVSRGQLMSLGLTRWQIMAELKARRWRSHGRQTVCTHTGPLNLVALRWHAVFEAGPRSAIDGVSALEHAGLTGFTADHVRVSVPRGNRVVRLRVWSFARRADFAPMTLCRAAFLESGPTSQRSVRRCGQRPTDRLRRSWRWSSSSG